MSKSHHHIAPLFNSLLWLLGALNMRNPCSSVCPTRNPGPGPADLSILVASSFITLQPLGSFFRSLNTLSWFLPQGLCPCCALCLESSAPAPFP